MVDAWTTAEASMKAEIAGDHARAKIWIPRFHIDGCDAGQIPRRTPRFSPIVYLKQEPARPVHRVYSCRFKLGGNSLDGAPLSICRDWQLKPSHCFTDLVQLVAHSLPSSPIGSFAGMARSKKTFISLYSGAGGLDLGFIQAGFRPLWAN